MKLPQRTAPLEVCLPGRLRSHAAKIATTLTLLIVLSALPAMAATGALYASGSNVPVGLLWIGSTENVSGVIHGHVWVADAGGFCRIDDDGNGNASITTTCAPALPGAITGQPSWDPSTNNVYIPTAAGIARYSFDPSLADPTQEVLVGPTANLGQPSATAVAFGPDGKLYFGFLKNGLIQRMTTPGAAAQTIEQVGQTSPTHNGAIIAQSVFGLAFQGGDLFINAKNFLQRIPFATTYCTGACIADDLNVNIAAVGSNQSNLAFFAPQGVSLPSSATSELIDQYDSVSQSTDQLSASAVQCNVAWVAYTCGPDDSAPIAYAAVIGMTADNLTGAVYVVDDTSAGATPNSGRIIRIAPPTVDGPVSFIAPIPPSVAPAAAGLFAMPFANGGMTSPGTVIILPDVWVLDARAGICRITNGALDLTTCVVLGGIPGQSSFDPATNLLYVPDKSANSRGVWRIPYNPATRTLNGAGATLVAANKGLGGNQPLCALLGPDGNLYVSFNKNGNILQITAPSTNTNTVTQVAASTDGKGVRSLAFVSKTITDGFGNPQTQTSLYMLQTAALTYSTSAIGGVKSKGAFVTPMRIASPVAIVSDGLDTIYVAQGGEIDTYTVSTQTSAQYSLGSAGPPTTFFGKITGLSNIGNTLVVGDDASGTGASGQGRIWID